METVHERDDGRGALQAYNEIDLRSPGCRIVMTEDLFLRDCRGWNMNMIIKIIDSKRDQLPLELAIIEPAGKPVGIVQFVHGMAEHKERYFDFMNFLSEHGYVCAIHDHRGHGASVKDPSHLGYFYTDDASVIVDDTFQMTEYLKSNYPDLNLTLFSHSMGTLVARSYLKKYDNYLDKIVLCGPPTKNGLVDLALFLARFSSIFSDKYKPNRFLDGLSVGQYNKGLSEKNAWICSDPAVVSAYNADPLCGFTFTTNGFLNLYQLLKSSFQGGDWNPQNNSLPILFMAGEDDPVIQSKLKFNDLERFLGKVGYTNISSKIYKNKRHELLNETGKETVYDDVLNFLRSDTCA